MAISGQVIGIDRRSVGAVIAVVREVALFGLHSFIAGRGGGVGGRLVRAAVAVVGG